MARWVACRGIVVLLLLMGCGAEQRRPQTEPQTEPQTKPQTKPQTAGRDSVAVTAVDAGRCDLARPVLLADPVRLRAAPVAEAAVVAELPRNAPVYRCMARDGWIAVMHPGPGRRADCSRRAAGDACPIGWARRPIPIGVEPG